MEKRCIIVGNRLPVYHDPVSNKLVQSSGGLVSALAGVSLSISNIWVGCIPDDQEKVSYGDDLYPVPIEKNLYDQYYNGMANDVIWPLFHYEGHNSKFSKNAWDAYVRVNKIFAEAIAKIAHEGDLVWIHDYHLFLLPQFLRQRKRNLKTGFFLHIPFPSSEVFRQLPVRKEILEGVLASNLIGFQNYEYVRHFAFSVQVILGLESNLLNINMNSHIAQLGVFPVGVDSEKFINYKNKPEVTTIYNRYRKNFGNRKLVLGVDRLDYIKGIDLKLLAFFEFLKKFPSWRGKVTLLQIAVPTRTDVDEYLRTQNEIERMIGMINGKFALPGYVPVQYMFTSIPFENMVALYRLADVLFVASKRDGMNLVSMEYILSSREKKPGVVLMSEFAGASSILSHVVRINPWYTADSAEKLNMALGMSVPEKKKRLLSMLGYLQKYNASEWAKSFISRLDKAGNSSLITRSQKIIVSASGKIKLPASFNFKKNIILFLDFDGTLTPIQSDPASVRLHASVKQLLCSIRQKKQVREILIVSGRPQKFLSGEFKNLPLSLVCEHGSKYYNYADKKWRSLLNYNNKEWFPIVASVMHDYSKHVPDSIVELKEFSISWHYRNSPSPFADYQSRKLTLDLDAMLSGYPVSILNGKKVIEVKPLEANKGSFVQWYANTLFSKDQAEDYLFIAIGDDTTDEDMFRAISPFGISIRVGAEETNAQYFLEKQSDVKTFLETLNNNLFDT